jgi:hypothetical protein
MKTMSQYRYFTNHSKDGHADGHRLDGRHHESESP